jgi:hypothetical protein
MRKPILKKFQSKPRSPLILDAVYELQAAADCLDVGWNTLNNYPET